MLDRLKSLPLTIILTILIWMYAESQFTTSQDNVPVSVTLNPTPEYTLKAKDPATGQWTDKVPLRVTLQGPQAQIDRINNQVRGTAEPDPEFTNLALDLTSAPLHPGTDNSLDVLPALNHLAYFRRRGLTVTAASPARLQLDVAARAAARTLTLENVPIAISGDTEVLRTYNVELNPRTITLQLVGTDDALRPIKDAQARGPIDHLVRPTLDLFSTDRPAPTPSTRAIRYILPPNVQPAPAAPKDVQFRLTERALGGVERTP